MRCIGDAADSKTSLQVDVQAFWRDARLRYKSLRYRSDPHAYALHLGLGLKVGGDFILTELCLRSGGQQSVTSGQVYTQRHLLSICVQTLESVCENKAADVQDGAEHQLKVCISVFVKCVS